MVFCVLLSEPGFSGLVDFQDCEFGLSTFRSYGTVGDGKCPENGRCVGARRPRPTMGLELEFDMQSELCYDI